MVPEQKQLLKSEMFWDFMERRLTVLYRHFRTTCHFMFKGQAVQEELLFIDTCAVI